MDDNLTQGFEAYIRTNENTKSITLKIAGVNCAGCIQKIESSIKSDSKVTHVRLNFTNKTLLIEWDGDDHKANDFVDQIINLGYSVTPYKIGDQDQKSESKFLLLCLGVSGFASGNIMLLSFGLWITDQDIMGFATREFLHFISALIAVPAVLFAGRPFFRSAWQALKHRRTNMDVPISLALILATGMSLHELVRNSEHVYFDSALMLCFFLLIGRYLDFRAKQNARSAAADLMNSFSDFATIVDQDTTKKIPIRDVEAGMIIRVAVGEKFPVDGIIVNGDTDIDTSLVTGETVPRHASENTDVFAGTMNLSAPVTMRAAKAAHDSLLADIVRLTDKAQQSQAAYTRLADRAARLYTPMVHTLSFLAFILWFLIMGAPWQDSLMIAVTVLIITCPCALGLAVPVAQVLATSQLIKNNIMVKSGDALERLAAITHIFLDKTGTLTLGRPKLIKIPDHDKLQLAASLSQHSHHPFSRAITEAYDGKILPITDVEEIPGKGLQGVYKSKTVQLGSAKWLATNHEKIMTHTSQIWLAIDGRDPVCFEFNDALRDDIEETLSFFKKMRLSLTLLSGDRDQIVQNIAQDVGVDQAYGDLSPTDKYAYLENARAKGDKILMIGDGLNDAPVLAGADVSIAPGTAIDMAQNAADIVFMGDHFTPVKTVYQMATKTQKIIRQNFTIAVIYNLFAIPLAFMGLVTPMIAAIAMSGSSLLVIANSFRLKSNL